MVVLQGLRKLQYLAKADLSGSILGLLISVPLYYVWGIKAIVPTIIISSIVFLLRSWYFSNKIKLEPVKVSKTITIAEGKNMLIMGFMISLSGLITLGVGYLVRVFISRTGGVGQVGLYNAGFSIIITYVGMIFTAMATDYYPRLSAVAYNNELSKKTINEQAEIALLILAPIIMVFLVFINWVVIILYSTKFIAINEMVHWAALGMLFKAASFPIGYIFVAKGDSKIFLFSEVLANIYILLFSILGYYFLKLEGLGISFFIGYILVYVQVYIIAKVKYNFSFSKAFLRVFLIQLVLTVVCFILVKWMSKPYSYIIGCFLIVLSAWFSFKELNKRIGIKASIYSMKNKYFRKKTNKKNARSGY
jgi:O-antigen/teichoic acid export membrane protein